MPEIIFDGQHIQALYDDRGGDTLLITFNEVEIFANGATYWGDKVAAKLGLSCVGIMTKSKNWFPFSEMQEVAEATKMKHRQRKIVTYGFSQGGYGAVKYSRLLGATHAMAFSPQWSINPEHLGGVDRRFTASYDDILHQNMQICDHDVGGCVRIFVDPNNVLDQLNASEIRRASPEAELIPCFNLGHGTVRAVSSVGALSDLIEHCQKGETDVRALSLLIRKHKKPTFAFTYSLGQRALRRGKGALSLALYTRARAMNASHPYLPDWDKRLKHLGLLG